MHQFRGDGRVDLGPGRLARAAEVFHGESFDDDETLDEITRTFERSGYLCDPHTAVGLAAARAARRDPSRPMVALATAHPAKFPDAVEAAIGLRPALPDELADLFDRPERFTSLPNDIAEVEAFVRSAVGA
jgi:threonine synthase